MRLVSFCLNCYFCHCLTFPRTAGLGVKPLSIGKEAKTAIICVAQSDWGPDCKSSVYVVVCGACTDEAWLFDKLSIRSSTRLCFQLRVSQWGLVSCRLQLILVVPRYCATATNSVKSFARGGYTWLSFPWESRLPRFHGWELDS